MNILIYDKNKIPVDQLKHIMDTLHKISDSPFDWISLPKGIDVIQDAPVEYLIHYRDMLNKYIEKQQEAENEKSRKNT